MIILGLIKRFTPKKPIVTGTLIHWNEATPNQVSSEYLTERKKAEIKIGKGAQNDIIIPDESLADEHIIIIAERTADKDVQLILHPKAPIRKGYREYTNDLPLEDNIEYMMGKRKFKHISEL